MAVELLEKYILLISLAEHPKTYGRVFLLGLHVRLLQ